MMKMFKNNFFWGITLSILLIVGFVSVTSGKTTIKTIPTVPEHEAWLHSLFLSGQDGSWLRISTGGKNLDILNGLIIGNRHEISEDPSLVVIGGGYGSKISKSNGGIGGGSENKMDGENGAIGGGNANTVGTNGAIGGGNANTAGENGAIGGGKRNSANGSRTVILGGYGNTGWRDSLILGSGAQGAENSFVWNAKTTVSDSARIDAANGVLIGRKTTISGVKLAISGAVKIGAELNPQRGAIMFHSGLIRFYDGSNYHILGLITGSSLGDNSCGCWFGSVKLEVGDIVKFYSKSYSTNCENIAFTGQCLTNGKRSRTGYPYCYEISPDVRLHESSGNGGGGGSSGLVRPNGLERERIERGEQFEQAQRTPFSN